MTDKLRDQREQLLAVARRAVEWCAQEMLELGSMAHCGHLRIRAPHIAEDAVRAVAGEPAAPPASAAGALDALLDELEGICGGYETAGERQSIKLDQERAECRQRIRALAALAKDKA